MVIDNATEPTLRRPADPPSPPAARHRAARWLGPQTVLGALLVLTSVAVGARVISAADHTVPVLVAVGDISAGQPLTPEMVEVRNVALDGGNDLYLTGDVGSGYVAVRPVQAGELLPRSAIVAADEVVSGADALRYVTLAVPTTEVPSGLVVGDAVDVWLTPAADSEDRSAGLLAAGLTVSAADVGGGALGVDGVHATVTLAVGEADADALDELVGRLLAAGRDGLLYLTKLPARVGAE